MEETLKLNCETCGIGYDKPKDLKEWYDKRPNVFYKWSLLFCDDCRRKKERESFKRLPEVLKALSNSFEK